MKIDFPRLPLTSNVELFRSLVSLGDELVRTHLLERELPAICIYPADGHNVVEAVRWSTDARDISDAGSADGPSAADNLGGGAADADKSVRVPSGRVWINSQQYFDGVPTEVWNFHIGGYQVCHKWLKDRKGRTLSYDDLVHYKKIVSALSETIRLMAEIDSVITEHGGFPLR